MRADELKQALKNGVYRSIGEAATGAGVVDGIAERTLCVLMYHKVNDTVGNTMTVPTSQFDEQMAQLRELDYTVVSLDDVLAHYLEGRPLPTQAVLITFDDAYLDNLENAVPILQQHGYPAVLFAPIGYLDGRRPLPHDEHLAARGIVNRTLDWSRLAELERGGSARRVARDRPPAARRPGGGRGRARDHALEAPSRGARSAARCGRSPT